jgi:hypothetical protein
MEVKHLACQENEIYSVLSILRNGHDRIDESFVHGLLQYFTTKEATIIRSVCSELKDAVEVTSWDDRETVIKRSMTAWKESFPCAISAKIDAHTVVLDHNNCNTLEKITIVNVHHIPVYILNIIDLQIKYCNQIRCNFEVLIYNE